MKITATITYLKQAEKRAEKKSHKKHYNTFIAILTDLQSKDLEQSQFLLIEKQLNTLQLNASASFKEQKRNFSILKKFFDFRT